ncbi:MULTISPECIES: MlaC/ttg2D family ABC transporter substrate-binding protein [Silvimonas]|uniref:MlaC/ttg2D family ABC transporter substrate-binding protein n=1 Tax=Silvimonas TaxID=300264 RepID=UPI0024B36BE4|nr:MULTISPECIES: ABC transporter substrate-binding protein [Silvimonas]MDR3425894.1 ABC transporter substrate-binding protein [Silvimonas sp.]
MTVFKNWLAAICVAALLPGAAFAAPAATDSPEQIVRSVSKDVLDILKKNDKDTSTIRSQVETRLVPLADFNRMTALAVGRYWKSATPDQQQALTKEFRTMLVRTYLSALTIYKNAQVDVKGSRPGDTPDEQTVQTEVNLPGQKPIGLDFNFEKTDAGWKVFDISVEGISFINSHRNQFGTVIRKDGIDGLIKQLAASNAGSTAKTGSAAK